jgi:RNA polymerase sigma-70 factor (ECF subfamily)
MAEPTNLPDADLLRRARDGDHAAFQELLSRHGGDLRRFAEARLPAELRRRVSVADVLQEAHVVALDRASGLEVRDESSVRKWLFKIVELKVKEAVRLHRRAKRSVGREASVRSTSVPDVAARQETPSVVVSSAETTAIARAALDALPPHYREVLRLARDDGLRLGDVAARTGRSREAVKKLYARALSQFAVELRRRGALTRG